MKWPQTMSFTMETASCRLAGVPAMVTRVGSVDWSVGCMLANVHYSNRFHVNQSRTACRYLFGSLRPCIVACGRLRCGVGEILMWAWQLLADVTGKRSLQLTATTYSALMVSPPLPMTRPTIALGQSMHAVCLRHETSVIVRYGVKYDDQRTALPGCAQY